MTLWLGLDLGTSSVKVVAVDADGAVVATARAEYSTHRPAPEIAEQDADDYLTATAAALAELEVDLAQVTGVGLSGQTPTAVFVDAAGRPVRRAMTWQDSRAVAEADELARTAGDPVDLFGTPLAWSATAIPAKLLWIARHEPETLRATRWVLQPKDHLGFHLTGSPLSDPWSSKGLCDVLTGEPATDFLRHVGWPESVCPPTAAGPDSRGAVTPEAADRFGLPAGTPVAVGWSDAVTAMLRVGAFSAPTAFVLTGTSDIVGQSFADDAPQAPGLLTLPRTCAPLAVTFGPTQSSGDAVAWLSRVLARPIPDLMELPPESAAAPPAFVPYVRGERAPLWDPHVRAAFSGVSAEHGAGDLVDAVLTGIGFGARHILETAGSGADAEVHVAGVSATIPRWTRARLETLGRTVVVHDEPNPSATGAAILGAASAGVALDGAVALVARAAERVTPTDEQRVRAERGYESYRVLSEFAVSASTAEGAAS